MTDYAMLCTERRDILVERQCPVMAEVQTRQTMLCTGEVHLALRERLRPASRETGEDLARVVGCLAEGVIRLQGQLMPEPRRAELKLHPVVIGVGCVRTPADDAQVAIHAAELWMNCLAGSQNGRRSCARCQS